MRDKLKELGIRLTELSDYLGYSRPTLYKYLEDYENKNYKTIDFKVRKVFDFIMKKRTLSKIEVINYIIDLNNEGNKTDIDKLFEAISNDKELSEILIDIIEDKGIEDTLLKIKKIIVEGDVKND